jgi:alkanesulfonate monooxygenase SsuD/methylene tetrahydromethanopterin reductase-like flavin-dependent oxidoreductase (luciferase family)
MRFGLHTGQHQVSFDELRSLWRDAEAWGFDACYVFDHVVPLHSSVEGFLPEEAAGPDGPCLEAFTALAALSRSVGCNVGLMVAGVGYRSAGYVAHVAATLSGATPGRVEIGIGTGWFEPDYRVLGLPFPRAGDRLDELEQVLEFITDAFRDRPGRPRWWVAGTGERRTIPIAARFADSWKAPWFAAPSPKNDTATWSVPSCFAVSAAPVAIGMPPPTMPFAPRFPFEVSAMCMDPPRPRQ